MELIKFSEKKTKLRLDQGELERYGLCREKTKNIKAVERLLTELKTDSGISLLDLSARVRIIFLQGGGCEIVFEKINKCLKVRTYIFDEKNLERILSALGTSEALKSSALYEYRNTYIWEYLDGGNSPFPRRLADFGREVELVSRRDFLTLLCKRLPFSEKISSHNS